MFLKEEKQGVAVLISLHTQIYLKGFFTCNTVGLCYPLSTKQRKAQGGANTMKNINTNATTTAANNTNNTNETNNSIRNFSSKTEDIEFDCKLFALDQLTRKVSAAADILQRLNNPAKYQKYPGVSWMKHAIQDSETLEEVMNDITSVTETLFAPKGHEENFETLSSPLSVHTKEGSKITLSFGGIFETEGDNPSLMIVARGENRWGQQRTWTLLLSHYGTIIKIFGDDVGPVLATSWGSTKISRAVLNPTLGKNIQEVLLLQFIGATGSETLLNLITHLRNGWEEVEASFTIRDGFSKDRVFREWAARVVKNMMKDR
jgi:hypothetical protein